MRFATLEEIEARRKEILIAIDAPDANIDALTAEVDELKENETELRAQIEARDNLMSKIASGEGTEIRSFKEETKVENKIEVRNTPEYGKAFVKGILKGEWEECRTLLSDAVSGGTVPVPTMLDDEIRNAWENCEVLSLAKHTSYPGNVKVGFEMSAEGALVHKEGAAPGKEEVLVWGTVELKAENIKKWITVSDEALENTTINTLANIYAEVAQRIVEEAEEQAIAKITASPATSTKTAVAVPVSTADTLDTDTITLAVAELSGKAKNLVAVMNRRTEAAFKSAAKKAKYAQDPFDGIRVVHTDALPAFGTAGAGDTYAIVGDFGYGFQANFPAGNDVKIIVDDLSLAEKDLVKIVGRQFVGMGVVAPYAFVKVAKANG